MMAIDITLSTIIGAAMLCLVGAAVVILHPRIHEGLPIKLGLILLAVGSLAMASHVHSHHADADDLPMLRAMALCSAGLFITLAGLAWRIWRSPSARAAALAASGWAPLDDDGPDHVLQDGP